MATALDAAHTRQPIPVLDGPVPTEEAEQISALLSLFDDALEMHRKRVALTTTIAGARTFSALFTIWANESPYAEYCVRLWASANRLALNERPSRYAPCAQYPNGSIIRSIEVRESKDDHDDIFRLQWQQEPIEGPVQSNVIPLPSAPPLNVMPLSNADERKVIAALDDASERFSLLELE